MAKINNIFYRWRSYFLFFLLLFGTIECKGVFFIIKRLKQRKANKYCCMNNKIKNLIIEENITNKKVVITFIGIENKKKLNENSNS